MYKGMFGFILKKTLRLFTLFYLNDAVVVLSGSGGAAQHSQSNFNYAKNNFKNRNIYFVTCYESNSSIYSIKGFFLSHFSKTIIADNGIPYSINLKNKVVYQTWHGLTLKKIGLKDENLINKLKNYEVKAMLLQWSDTDYIFCPSDYMEKIFKESFNIRSSSVLKENTPYIEDIRKLSLVEASDTREKRKSILYLPTYRDWESDRAQWDVLESSSFLNYINNSNINLYYKYHPFDSQIKNRNLPTCFIEVKGDYLTYLSKVDLLITDFSSTYFDAKYAGVNSLIYAPDYTIYNEKRGLIDMGLYESSWNNKSIESILFQINEILKVNL